MRTARHLPRLALLAGPLLLTVSAGTAAAGSAPLFEKDVLPIFRADCLRCHGGAKQKAGLDLRSRGALLKGGDSGPAVAPGSAERSELWVRVAADKMPPGKHKLSEAEKALIRAWIDGGAKGDAGAAVQAPPSQDHPVADAERQFWAFRSPVRPAVPAVRHADRVRNPIDAFLLAALEKKGLTFAPEADRLTLLRRASFDLLGLPPSPEEIDRFLGDRSPDAYERLIDRLLASERYGERWGRHWLDLAGYADSEGILDADYVRSAAWRYRDYVIRAFNQDKPYDRFLTEQLAGDELVNYWDAYRTQKELSPQVVEALTATGYLRCASDTSRPDFVTIKNAPGYYYQTLNDTLKIVSSSVLGLTVQCAKCHSHKYDPITQTEYYRFYAFFNQTADNDQPDEQPTLAVPSEEQRKQNQSIDARIAQLKQQAASPSLAPIRGLVRAPVPVESLPLLGEIARLEKSRPNVPKVPVMVELPPNRRRQTHLMIKGNFLNPGEKVEPGVPAAFHALPKHAPRDRLGVAKWLLDAENPLTARVAVNRYWAQLFGIGLVETEEDFGTQGEMPSHPQLLDWLATEYVRLGWDTKAFLKLLVTSATYRQSSKVTPNVLAKDPRNRLLSRGPRFRLEAEMVRDQALMLSGLLSRKMHGPSVYPPQPPGLWQAAFNGERTWATSKGEDR
ncbi:MAG TPA: PSD1 and planctomycete cytochrome C domain-containing protein, partial [Gemmataceae bacterium]|nr:PSD1 and planctomycete cytochrome C domain-containing protein [Gemmataceae bacterium]